MDLKVIERLRDAAREGGLDAYLDGLGRSAARKAGPRYVDEMDKLVGANMPKGGDPRKRRPPERSDRPGQLQMDYGEGVPEMIGKLSEVEYQIGKDRVRREDLMERLDLVVQLQQLREADAAFWQAKEDHARNNREWAMWDANILRVVIARLSAAEQVAAE